MKQLIAFVFLIGLFIACTSSSDKSSEEAADNDPLTFKMVTENFTGNEQIYNGDSLHAEMTFEYPVFSGGKPGVARKINDYLMELLQSTDFGISDTVKVASTKKPLGEIADDFFADAKDSAIPGYMFASAWAYEFKTDTLMLAEDKEILTLRHSYYSFMGGAHPNHYANVVNIDLKTGEVIPSDQLFENNFQLLEVVKKYFIANETAIMKEANMEFSMKDYWFENGFALPAAMGLTRKGIYCLYNPYEVASYARGDIEFTVPYAEVKKKFW